MRKGQDAVSRIKQAEFHSIAFKYHGMDYGFAGWWLLQWGNYSSEGHYPRFIAQGEKIYKTKEEFLADLLFDGKTFTEALSEITDIDITINPFGPISNWEGTRMISRDTVLEDMRKVRKELDSEVFPEVCRYLDTIMDKKEAPYIIASNLVECDKPKIFPEFLVEYITLLYELEIEDGNHYAMNDLGARYYRTVSK